MCSVIQSDVPRRSIDKDMHCERIGQMGARKYLRKSCYHRIECSVTNSLAALMRKWYLNNSFQPYIYSLKTLRRCWGRSWCDKDQDQQSNLRVEGRDERKKIVKNRREVLRERDRGIKKRRTVATRTGLVINFDYIQELISSNCVDDDFLK